MKTYKEAIVSAWLEKIKTSDYTLRRRSAVRLALRYGSLAQETFNQAQAEGVIPEAASLDDPAPVEGPDWAAFFDGLTKFIEVLAPILLQLLKLL